MSDLQLYCDVPADANLVFQSWMHSYTQGDITQALAKIDPRVEGVFELWNAAVTGQFLEIDAPRKIRMTWRTVEFEEWMPPSIVRLEFQQRTHGSRFVVTHEMIPHPMLGQFTFAWKDVYMPNLQLYFAQRG